MTDEGRARDSVGREDLRALKGRVRDKYLGRSGIHGLGTRQAEDAICVYVRPGAPDLAETLKQLEAEIAPRRLVVIDESPPRT